MQIKQIILVLGAVCIAVLTTLLFVLEPTPVVETEPVAEEIPEPEVVLSYTQEVVGASVEGRAIEAFSFGTGDTELLFVGGIHGGYEWNSVLLAYEFIDHFIEDPTAIPASVTVRIIPNLNPDAVAMITDKEGRFTVADIDPTVDQATARFNAHGVDLNRNFDCKWQSESSWRGKTVSAGTAAFSEPESVALRDYVLAHDPEAVVFWHSQASNVYASECEAGVLPETLVVMQTYADAAGYGAVPSFDAYPVTGDAEGYLASIGVPAVTVELSTHESIEWKKNLAGVEALLEQYSESPGLSL